MRSRLGPDPAKRDCFSACERIPTVDGHLLVSGRLGACRPGPYGRGPTDQREHPEGERRMSRRIAVVGGASLAAAFVLSVMPVRAQTLYFGGEGGWTLLQDQQISSSRGPTATERF